MSAFARSQLAMLGVFGGGGGWAFRDRDRRHRRSAAAAVLVAVTLPGTRSSGKAFCCPGRVRLMVAPSALCEFRTGRSRRAMPPWAVER
jgi:hypothetical protein